MNDDWRNETQARLQQSVIYKELKEKSSKDPAGAQVLALVDDAVFYSYQRTKSILCHMGEFTLHDGEHLFRVLHLMEKLLTVDNIHRLYVPELLLLILSAFFHDIGMAPDQKDVLAWKKIWDFDPKYQDENERIEAAKFKRFCSARPDEEKRIKHLHELGEKSTANLLQDYLISEYIRLTHSMRAKEIIQKDWDNKIIYRDTDFTVEFAEICFSHSEDASAVLELDANYLCGPETYACLPLIAIVLRLADILDFDGKRTPALLFSHLAVRNAISVGEWQKHRAIEAWSINDENIIYHAKCTHPAIEASIHAFCDLIDNELSISNNVLSKIPTTTYRHIDFKIPLKVNRSKIGTKKDIHGEPIYLYKLTQFNLSKSQVIDLLMGTKLYGDPEVAIRELLQNSIDACLLRVALENKWGNAYEPEIRVKYYTENSFKFLEIDDNGIGMDQYIIDKYYSKIGSSFYTSTDFYDLKSEYNANFTPCSRFGIGILSCFMVADTLIVDTRKLYGPHDSSAPLYISIEGQESIFWIKKGSRKTPGTTTKLILRPAENPWDELSEKEFINSVEAIIPNPPFKILIETDSQQSEKNQESFKLEAASTLKDYSWNEHENISEYKVSLDFPGKGIVGSAIVGILEKRGKPTKQIWFNSKEIEIDGEMYELEKKALMQNNKIELDSTTITIDDEGKVASDSTHQTLCESKSQVSLHGILIPTSLFPSSWSMQKNQVKITWPFPLLLVADICGERDLDLNSSRTQIIMSEKWNCFEEDLVEIICRGIRRQVADEYWNELVSILNTDLKDGNFKRGLERIS